ncbi:hypothetical protein IPA_06935 [Ignicoccus pacificus DSM 13166]|uniref:Peptidase S8/S53 domain-containing protein n=1 Tax=Ignicoccus pacificus DSM 13166 TaxID=940294 RepID=A0A977KBM7_9CREN|nr:hypothetical protein IPA_06935 [Ignicoccus pacificus DSM 13166]
MKRFAPLLILSLLILLPIVRATVDIYIESPAVSIALHSLSKYMTWDSTYYALNLTSSNLKTDEYAGKVFTPSTKTNTKIVLVDTGVVYNNNDGNFLCNMAGVANTSLINYLKNNNLCLSTGTVRLSDIANVQSTYTLVDGGNTYTLPSADETYEYCITNTNVLSNAGFNVGNEGNTSKADTVIILQPTSWKTDLVGHGTMVAGALCGYFDYYSDTITDLNDKVHLKTYTGAALGSDVFVVDMETVAIILPDYTPQITSGITPQSLIASAKTSGSVSTFYLDYDFKYLGSQLGALAVNQALSDAQTAINNFLGDSKAVVLIEPLISDTETNVQNYCNTLETTLSSINAVAAVAPLGNDGEDVTSLNNNNGIYLWPAQCNDVLTSPTVPVYPVSGFKVEIDSTYNTVKITNVTDFNYDENPNNLWFTMSGEMDSTNNYYSVANYGTDANGNSYTLELQFTGLPTLYSGGSILSPSGTYGQVAIPDVSTSYDSTKYILTVSVPGSKGTSLASAYFAASLVLLGIDPTASTPSQVYSHLDAMTTYKGSTWGYGVDNDFGSYYEVSFAAVWKAAIQPDTGMSSSEFPFDIGYLPPNLNQLPATGGSSTASTQTTTTTPGSMVTINTSTFKPFNVKLPAPALLAPVVVAIRKKLGRKKK